MRRFFHWLVDLLFKYSLYVSSFALLGLNIVDISNVNEKTMLAFGNPLFPIGKVIYYFFCLLALAFGVWAIENSRSVTILEDENREQADKIVDLEIGLNDAKKGMQELFNSYLLLLVKSLNFNHTERISVYKIFDNNFILMGRTSSNPTLRKPGRNHYPLDEGFIGKAWAEGELYINNLPDPAQRGGNQYYTAINAICPIPRPVIQAMNMLSRTFYILRIDGYNQQPKAIIVVESLNPNAFTKADVEQKVADIMQPLIMFVENNNRQAQQSQNQIGL